MKEITVNVLFRYLYVLLLLCRRELSDNAPVRDETTPPPTISPPSSSSQPILIEAASENEVRSLEIHERDDGAVDRRNGAARLTTASPQYLSLLART